ncbi:MAG TPA: MurR/RpiR family transcriptional regulator [Oscillospiraceae bacterium]|nr:MurR/RpiR family transcriptional regulator [Oscillospiraceae bacterium]
MSNKLISRIEKVYPKLSKGHKAIATYIKEHYDKAAFMTAAALGEKVGVSESTVVRFAMEIGYEGYPGLQKSLQELIKSRLTSVQRMEVANTNIDQDKLLDKALTADIEMIKSTLERTSRDAFSGSVEAINKARRIYILGVRSSASLASFMAFYFNLFCDNVVLVESSGASEMFEQLYRIGADDVCIAISFPRYSSQTVNALRFVNDRGATIISITDSESSPIALYAKYLLIAGSSIVSFVDSLVAPLSLINALIAAAARGRRDEVQQNLNTLESIWDEYQVYQVQQDDDSEEDLIDE